MFLWCWSCGLVAGLVGPGLLLLVLDLLTIPTVINININIGTFQRGKLV